MSGWVLAFALLVALPDGRTASVYGRDNRRFATEAACVEALGGFHASALPLDAAWRVLGVSALCAPEPPPEHTPSPGAPERDYGA